MVVNKCKSLRNGCQLNVKSVNKMAVNETQVAKQNGVFHKFTDAVIQDPCDAAMTKVWRNARMKPAMHVLPSVW